MSSGRPLDIHWTGGLDRTVGQAWSVRRDVQWTSIGQVDWTGQWDKPGQRGWRCPVGVHWTGGLDRTVGQAWSVRVDSGRPLDRWIGQGQWDKPGQ